MSKTQDKFEKTLKDIHLLFADSQQSLADPDMVMVDKKKIFQLLNQLNVYVYQLLDENEVTDAARDRVKREALRRGDKMIADAQKQSESVYAAAVMYTNEALNHIQNEIDSASDNIKNILKRAMNELDEQKKTIKSNKHELTEQLQDMADAKTYLRIIDERRSELEKKALQLKKEKDQADTSEKKSPTAPEVKINAEYFEKTGRSITETYGARDDEPEEPKVQAEVSVNLDAEYFKWKQAQPEGDASDSSDDKDKSGDNYDDRRPKKIRRFWSAE